jgi:hypothetical protein
MAMKRIRVGLGCAIALLVGAASAHAQGTVTYSQSYAYDAGKVTRSQIVSQVVGSSWDIDYVYTPLLAEAHVRDQAGVPLRQYKYVRDVTGRLLKKLFISPSGIEIGKVEIRYGSGGEIVDVVVNAPADLPSWDPVADK